MRRVVVPAGFLLGLLLISPRANIAQQPLAHASSVSTSEGVVTEPTYENSGRELQPPLFPDSAVTGIYPFPTYTMPLKANPTPRTYKAIFVENEYLKLTYLPDFGGRFLSLYDKLRKKEVFYKNDVVKPTQMNARGDWPQEGIELTGPFDIHSLTLKQDPFWSNTVLKNSNGSVTLMLSEIDPFYGMKVSLSATLYPGVAAMEISVFCFNPNTSRMPQMFWTNASFPATPETRFIYPMTRTVGHNTGQVTDWPMYEGVDYSLDRNNKNMLGVFGIDLYDNFGGAYQFDRDYGVFRFADRRVVQGMKMWTFGHGRDAASIERAYTDKAGPYFEAQSGRHVWDGHYEWVAPHQVEQWSEWWIPVGGTKGLSTITKDIALNLRVIAAQDDKSSTIEVDLSPVRSFTSATLNVTSGTGKLLSEQVDLQPGTVIHRTIRAPISAAALRDLQVLVTDAKGAALLTYRRPNAGERRSEYSAFTKELEKPVKQPDQMSEEELVLAAESKLKDLDAKSALALLDRSLKKDPGYSLAHTLKGIIFYKDGKFEDAENELQQAVDRDPYADRAWYYLGVTQLARGEEATAERNFYYIWPNSAFFGNREYELGHLALLHNDPSSAIPHLEGALNSNGQDLSARLLLAMAYRTSGAFDLATRELAKLLELDPSNRGAYAERFLATRDTAARSELQRLMGDQTQEALRVADTYGALQRWREAATILGIEAAHNSDPWGTSAVFYYTLAYDLKQAGDSAGAVVELKRARASEAIVDRFPSLASSEAPLNYAVSADPQDKLARFDLGCLLYYLGRPDEAISQWEAAARIKPSDFKVQRALGLAYAEKGEGARSIAQLEKALAIDSTHLGTVNDLVRSYASAGRLKDELTLLHQSLQRSPNDDDLTLRLLHVDLVQGHYDEASQIVETHTFSPRHRDNTLRDEYRELKYAEGSQAFTRGDYAKALELFRAVETPPSTLGVDDFQFQSTPRLHYYLGRTLDALNRKDEAKAAYEQSVKEVDLTAGDIGSYNSDNFFMLLSLDRLGRTSEAASLVTKFAAFAESQKTLERAHRRAEGEYILALIALRQGQTAESTRLMEASLKIEPDFLAPRFDVRGDSIEAHLATQR